MMMTMYTGTVRGTRQRGMLLLSLVVFATSGCTHLAVEPDRLVTRSTAYALPGATYSLPMLQYDLTVTRTLSACPDEFRINGVAGSTARHYWSDDLSIDLAATAVPNQISGERYRINYSKLDSWMKTTSFTIEYQPGGSDLLKSVNVAVDDKTGEVVGNVVKAGIAIAGIASGPAGAATAGAVLAAATQTKADFEKDLKSNKGIFLSQRQIDLLFTQQDRQARTDERVRLQLIALLDATSKTHKLITCTAPVAAMLAERKTLADKLKTEGEKLTDTTKSVEALTKLASVSALSKQRRDDLSAAAEDLLKLSREIETRKESVAQIERELGAVKTLSWPGRFSDAEEKDLATLGAGGVKTIADLLAPAAIDARVIDAARLAPLLAAHPDLAEFRRIAPDFVVRYVDDKGAAKRFGAKTAPAGCDGTAPDIYLCLTSLTTLRASLVAVVSDTLPVCDTKNEPECLTVFEPSDKTKKGEKAKGDVPPVVALNYVDARAAGEHSGLFVRPPVRATLSICRVRSASEEPNKGGCAPGTRNLVKDDKILAPQLGQLRYFRLVNQAFSNNSLMLSLTKEGAIEKFQYASTKSIAQGLSAVAADAATQYAAYDKQRDEERRKNEDPVAILQKEIDLRTAKDKLAAFDAVKNPTELEQIALAKAKADLAYIQAQTAFVGAQAAVFASKAADQ